MSNESSFANVYWKKNHQIRQNIIDVEKYTEAKQHESKKVFRFVPSPNEFWFDSAENDLKRKKSQTFSCDNNLDFV